MVDKELEKIAKGSMIVLVGMILSKVFNYLYRLIVARYLGPDSYGLLNLGFAVIGFFTAIALLGFPSGVLRFVSFYKGKDDLSRIKGTILSSLKITLPLSIFLMIIMMFFSNQIAVKIFHNPDLTPILRIFSLLIPIIVVISNLESITQAFQKVAYNIFVRNVSESGIQFIATFILFLIGFGLMGAVYGYVIALASSAIIFVFLVQKKVFPIFGKKIQSIGNFKELASYTWPLTFVSVIGMIQNWGDNIFIGIFKSAAEVGLYNAALPMAGLLLIASTTITFLFVPIITELYAKDSKDEVVKIYKTTSKWIFFLNLPVLLILILFPKEVLLVLFGPEYMQAYLVLVVLSFGYFIYSLLQQPSGVLQSIKQTRFILFNSLLVTALNVILNITLIPPYGMMGAAISAFITFVVWYSSLTIKTYLCAKMHPFSNVLLRALFAALIAFFIGFILKSFIKINVAWVSLASIGIVSLLVYFSLLLLFRSVNKEDIILVKKIIKLK